MLIPPSHLSYWISEFYGYGSWKARFWFVGYDEPGGDLPEEVAEKLAWFFEQKPAGELVDLREVYRHVAFRTEGPKAEKYETQYDYRFGPKAIQHGIWKNLIAFVHGFDSQTVPDAFAYQKKKLAVASARREALIPLYPLPAPHSHSWYYSWLEAPGFPFLKSRAQYEEKVYQQRIETILRKLSEEQPELVLLYGMENINALKASIQDAFPGTRFTSIKATPLQIPQHHRTVLGNTKLILTTQIPALRHNRVETGFDWEAFGQLVSES